MISYDRGYAGTGRRVRGYWGEGIPLDPTGELRVGYEY